MPDADDLRYQVFVSSTFRDLQEERQKVLQAILEMKAFPAGMALFPLADDDQFEFIKREIESSDYYVAIVAGKYGSIAADGTSFTEKEYEYALQMGKPVMAFLFHNLGDLKGTQLEDAPEAKAKIAAFREKIRNGKLVKFYQNSDELKTQVWQALTHAFKLKPGQGWVRAKKASRIEDLQEINSLQKRLTELEAENAVLQASVKDPRDRLAHGSDAARWTVQLQPERADNPEPSVIMFTTTWDEVLAACFAQEFPEAEAAFVLHGIATLLNSLPEAANSKASRPLHFASEELERIFKDVKRQFLGLSYVDVRMHGNNEYWTLTQEGKLQIALLRGATR